MEHLQYELFQRDLLKDEKILWTGQPNPYVLFTDADIFFIPFSLLWGGFFLFFGITMWESGLSGLVFGLPFALVGSYTIFGRFLYKILKKNHTYYCLSDKRVLTVTTLFRRTLKTAYIDTIPLLHKSVRRNGAGTITFGDRPSWSSWYANTGMEILDWSHRNEVPAFYDIKDVDNVYRMAVESRCGEEPEEF